MLLQFWTTRIEVLNHFAGWTPREEALIGSHIDAEDETFDIDSDVDVADEGTLGSKIEDAVGAAADYHDAPHDASGAASSSTEPAVGVGAVPGFRAAQTPPLPGAVPGSRATPTTPAPDAVPGSRAVSEAVVPVAPPSRSTAVQTMRETLSLIGDEKIKLPGIVDQLVKFNKEVRTAFNFGPKFSIGETASKWNQFQHSVVQILPDQSGAATRNTREGGVHPGRQACGSSLPRRCSGGPNIGHAYRRQCSYHFPASSRIANCCSRKGRAIAVPPTSRYCVAWHRVHGGASNARPIQ